jgi:hypothetical protein
MSKLHWLVSITALNAHVLEMHACRFNALGFRAKVVKRECICPPSGRAYDSYETGNGSLI